MKNTACWPATARTSIVRLTPKNTITIASSISNGAGSALLAAEQDTGGLISGVAATEPQVQPDGRQLHVQQGGVPSARAGKALFDYSTYAALYQPCLAGSAGRCTALASKGLLTGATLAAQQSDAYARLHAYGWLPDSDVLQAAHAGTNILVAVTYAYAYGKFSVTDKLCGFSFAQTDANGLPVAFTAAQKASQLRDAERHRRQRGVRERGRRRGRLYLRPYRRAAAWPTSRSTDSCACAHWQRASIPSPAARWVRRWRHRAPGSRPGWRRCGRRAICTARPPSSPRDAAIR